MRVALQQIFLVQQSVDHHLDKMAASVQHAIDDITMPESSEAEAEAEKNANGAEDAAVEEKVDAAVEEEGCAEEASET